MADRSVVVRLRAEIGQYQAGMRKARDETAAFGKEVSGRGKTARADVEAVGHSALIAGGAMALGFGKAISTAMGFEKQMSGVRAVSGASAEEMERLSDAALAAGASQQLAGVTASDAAAAEAELVKAGVSVSDVLGGALMGSLTLAAAGQLDFADAATIAAQAMNIFDLSGGEVTHVADVLAAAANKSASDVGGLGDALRQGGLVAAQTGLSLEETVAALAAFADNALIGSDAGTSLKTMLQRLTPTSVEAANLMEEIGFAAYDAQGNFIGLDALAQELRTSMAGMTDEQRNLTMATLFGSDAVRGANVLYEEGAQGMRDYEEAVNDAGAAAEMAAIQNDNLSGDIEALGGAIESAMIVNGSKANGILRGMAQGATNAVNGFSGMPELVQTGAMALGAVATAGTLAVGALGTFGPKAQHAKESLEGMGKSGEFLANNLGKIAGGLTVLGAGVAVFAAWETGMAAARARSDELTASWASAAFNTPNTESHEAFVDAMIRVNDEYGDWLDKAAREKNPFKQAELQATADTLGELREEMELSDDAAHSLSQRFGISWEAALKFVRAQQAADPSVFANGLNTANIALAENFTATTTGTAGAHKLEGAMDTLGSEVASVEDQIKAFNDTLDALYNQLYGAEAARDAFQRGLNDMPSVVRTAVDAGVSLKDVLAGNSDAAIDLREHMRSMVSDASELVAEWQEQGAEGEELKVAVDMLADSFRQQAIDAGLPAPVVDHYLGLLRQIPTDVPTSLHVDATAANNTLNSIMERYLQLVRVMGGDSAEVAQAEKFLAGPRSIPGAASGGVRSGLTWVGEEGPELVNLGSPSRVFPHAESMAMVSAPAGSGAGAAGGGVSFGEVHLHYPAPEPTGVSMPRLVRKAAALMG